MDDPETLAQGRGQHTCPGRRANQRETLERKLQCLCICPAVHDEVDLEILHRRVKKLLDDAAEPVNLVDEENVALLQRRQHAHEILRFLERRAARRPKVCTELARDKTGERRLAEPRRTVKEHVFEGLPATLCGVDRDPQVFDHALLSDVLVEGARTKARPVNLVLQRVRRIDHSFILGGRGGFERRIRRTEQTSAYLAHADSLMPILSLCCGIFPRAAVRRRRSRNRRRAFAESLPRRRPVCNRAATAPRALRRRSPESASVAG